MKKLHISAIFLGILTILTFSGSAAHGLYHHVDSCTICHYGDQEPSECAASANLMLIKDEIDTPNSGSRGTLFGPYVTGAPDYNGICEVCHTTTTYHRNSATGDHTHYASENCIPCHKHTNEFGHGGGQSCDVCHGHAGGDGTAFSHGTHTEGTVSRGPATAMVCGDCHDTNNFPLFGADDAQETLAATAVCDPCHSQGGAYDGIAMAKNEWSEGIYEADGQSLKSGNDTWCVGCHDSEGATIGGRTADDMAGDNVVYGYYASGHGQHSVGCTDCHDPLFTHIDGYDRTYDAAQDMDGPQGYQQGFRLKSVNSMRPLFLPRLSPEPPEYMDWMDPNHFALCYDCHEQKKVEETNFNRFANLEDPDDARNLHWSDPGLGSPSAVGSHLGMGASWWDSDRKSSTDSAFSCPTCHDPHSRLPYATGLQYKTHANLSMTRQDMSIVNVREVRRSYGYMSSVEWQEWGGDLACQEACHSPYFGKVEPDHKYSFRLGTRPPEEPRFWTQLNEAGDITSPTFGSGGTLLPGTTFGTYTDAFNNSQTGMNVDALGAGAELPTSNLRPDDEIHGETIDFWFVPQFNFSGHATEEYLFHYYYDADNWIIVQVDASRLFYQIRSGGTNYNLRTQNSGLNSWVAGEARNIVCTWGPAHGMHMYIDGVEYAYGLTGGLDALVGVIQLPETTYYIGNDKDGNYPANGIIDDFKIYGYQYQDFSAGGPTLFSKMGSGGVSSPVVGAGGSSSASSVSTDYLVQHGSSSYFNGTNKGAVDFPTSNLNNDNDTIDFWYYPNFDLYGNTGNVTKYLFWCTQNVDNQAEIRVYNNRLQFRIEVNGENHILRTKIMGNGFKDGGGYMWYHIVCTWGPAGMHIYINDIEAKYKDDQQGGLTYYGPLFDPGLGLPANFRIGNRSHNNATYFCDGYIDELRVYGYQAIPQRPDYWVPAP